MERTLLNFPNNAKANYEMIGRYINNGPDYDLHKALAYAERALEINPDYCDVHLAIAKINLQLGLVDMYETHILQAIPCMNSYSQAYPEFAHYMQIILQDAQRKGANVQELQIKFEGYMERINRDLKAAYKEWNQYLPEESKFRSHEL